MADILDEVLNDEKDEKRLVIFRKVFPIIIGLTVIIAIIMGGYSWYSSSKNKHNQQIGDSFIGLISGEYQDGKLVDSLLEEISLGNENKVSELAAIKLTSRQIQANDASGAMKSLETIIDSKDYSDITQSYARILYISLILDLDKLDSQQENKSREYLQYFSHDSQIFYATATLLKSLFYLKNQQLDLANQYALEVLKLPRASVVIKEQAKAVLAQINYVKNEG
jgi:hypothetical protein